MYQRCNPSYRHDCKRKLCNRRQKMTDYYRVWFRNNFQTFLHSMFCFFPELCGINGCEHANKLFRHCLDCKEREYGICHFCRPMMCFMSNHSRNCQNGDECGYFYCKEIRLRRSAGKPLFKNPYSRKQA